MKIEEQKSVFNLALQNLNLSVKYDESFVFKAYTYIFENIEKIIESRGKNQIIINPIHLVSLIIFEYAYATKDIAEDRIKNLKNDEKFFQVFSRLIVDKYIINHVLAPRNDALINRYQPPISTLEMQVNNTLNLFNLFPQNRPPHTVFIDILKKCFDLMRAVTLLITRGYETEALSTWRTLHETECVVLVFSKYGDKLVNSYIKHIRYGAAFRGLLPNEEETAEVFKTLKEEMKSHNLKSKDMKRFIEYGWLYAISEKQRGKDFRINFRNGLESMAGLAFDADNYEMASEISHTSPLLIYSNPEFFMRMTIIQLYETFFNVEEVFNRIYYASLSTEKQQNYLAIRNRNLSDLKAIYKIEKIALDKLHAK